MLATYCCVSTVYCMCLISRHSTWSVWGIGTIWPCWIPARSGGSCDAHPVRGLNSCYTVHWCRQESLLSASCIHICAAQQMYNTGYISPCLSYGRSGLSSTSIDLSTCVKLYSPYRQISFKMYVVMYCIYLSVRGMFSLNHHLEMGEMEACAL